MPPRLVAVWMRLFAETLVSGNWLLLRGLKPCFDRKARFARMNALLASMQVPASRCVFEWQCLTFNQRPDDKSDPGFGRCPRKISKLCGEIGLFDLCPCANHNWVRDQLWFWWMAGFGIRPPNGKTISWPIFAKGSGAAGRGARQTTKPELRSFRSVTNLLAVMRARWQGR